MSMILAWKQKRENRRYGRKKIVNKDIIINSIGDIIIDQLKIPSHFRCPISLDLMKDPVTLSTGITYDRDCIDKWILAGNQTCPVTNQPLRNFDQIPNHSIRRMIQDWCVENKSFGIERIPTPRIPVSSYEVTDISSSIGGASQRKDHMECQQLVDKIKNLARESERNKNCIIDNGVGYVFASCFDTFAGDDDDDQSSWEDYEHLLKSILSELTWMMFPLGSEGQSKIGSQKSLRCIAWFLNGEDLSAKQHSVIVLKELLCNSSDNTRYSNHLLDIGDVVSEALFKIVKVPICQAATTAALTVMYHMLLLLAASAACGTLPDATSPKIVKTFLELGLVAMILEMLVEAEKNISEKALGVLDCLCNWEEGRDIAYKNALTMPLLVKKILRVSDLGTEFSVSALWKLCKGEDENGVVDAMEVGAFQKLLVILQVGCGEKTKEKTTELLKMMNLFRERVDYCSQYGSTGFKYLKRSS